VEISVVTINFNNKAGLEQTVSSVVGQTFPGFEFIIIDGGSTDGSLDIITNAGERDNYSISEKDNGIYDAMNKGIQQASGNYIMFLNSGDTLSNERVLTQAIEGINQFPAFDIYYGDMIIVNDANNPLPNHCTYPDALDLNFFKKDTLNHQASFIRADLFSQFGLYPLKYKLAADYWLFLLAFLNNKRFFHLPFPMVNYDLSGLSAQSNLYREEKNEIWNTLVPASIDKVLNENYELKHQLNYKLMKFARRLNSGFQKLKGND
jgi:glycosyltransferase involved in cell wall biosynthesis